MSQDRSFQSDTSPENVNVLPGGSNNTAGGRVKDANVVDAIKTIKPRDFQEVHKKPCVRDAFLAGIGIGFGTGGVRAILGGTSTRNPSECTY
jgi:cytochrome c oxidase assembly protein subunit 20